MIKLPNKEQLSINIDEMFLSTSAITSYELSRRVFSKLLTTANYIRFQDFTFNHIIIPIKMLGIIEDQSHFIPSFNKEIGKITLIGKVLDYDIYVDLTLDGKVLISKDLASIRDSKIEYLLDSSNQNINCYEINIIDSSGVLI